MQAVAESFTLSAPFPKEALYYPQLRFMGSKHRLLPWIHGVFSELSFDSAFDAFSGSGTVGYLLKAMGKRVVSNDMLRFCTTIAKAAIENSTVTVGEDTAERLLRPAKKPRHFIAETFKGIFYSEDELRFLDNLSSNLDTLQPGYEHEIAMAALIRACLKKQPRGVFTVADPERYKDGRRDLQLTLREHFLEQIAVYNRAVFDNGHANRSQRGDVFAGSAADCDLVYMDPPYVPRADDNCYIKRYHFLEGLSCYWEGLTIMPETRVRKIRKEATAFSYRHSALDAFDRMFRQFAHANLVLSYSSNGFPDLDVLCGLMRRYKRHIDVHQHEHRYHFGTHRTAERVKVQEYLIVGT